MIVMYPAGPKPAVDVVSPVAKSARATVPPEVFCRSNVEGLLVIFKMTLLLTIMAQLSRAIVLSNNGVPSTLRLGLNAVLFTNKEKEEGVAGETG